MKNKKNFAGFWIRHIALFIDIVILFLFSILVSVVLNLLGVQLDVETTTGFLIGLFFDLFCFFYFACFHYHFGKTPGKMLVGVKVVTKDFGKITKLQSLGRSFATILSALPLFLGYAWAGWDSKKRTFHDLLARTVVIEENAISKNWVIFWNVLISLLFIIFTFGIVALFSYVISHPEILMQM